MHILDQIIEGKRRTLSAKRELVPIEDLMRAAEDIPERATRFSEALLKRKFALIAETKRSSPSQGSIIEGEYDPVAIARRFEEMGAAAISVLTEENHFQGSIEDLKRVSASVSLPCLCKDFIFDEYQVYEAKAAGASAILLICRLFGHEAPASLELAQLFDLATALRLDVLMETHNEQEVQQALEAGAEIIGVNARDLDTLEINPRLLDDLVDKIPGEKIVVAESGLSNVSDLEHVQKAGARAALIGTALLKGDAVAGQMLDHFKASS